VNRPWVKVGMNGEQWASPRLLYRQLYPELYRTNQSALLPSIPASSTKCPLKLAVKRLRRLAATPDPHSRLGCLPLPICGIIDPRKVNRFR
jgi:hypothetical protein